MKATNHSLPPILAAAYFVAMAMGAPTAVADNAETTVAARPVAVELFTSQSCSSCPPAESLFADLSNREDLVVIEWHVDYWDTLSYGRAGVWKDPYSSATHTERQRAYNVQMRGMNSVYTPQAVINGHRETTGSRRAAINALIDAETTSVAALEVSGQTVAISDISASYDGTANLIWISLLPNQETDVLGGENKGRHLFSRNIAMQHQVLALWTAGDAVISLPALEDGLNCALLLQDTDTMEILAAQYCNTN